MKVNAQKITTSIKTLIKRYMMYTENIPEASYVLFLTAKDNRSCEKGTFTTYTDAYLLMTANWQSAFNRHVESRYVR